MINSKMIMRILGFLLQIESLMFLICFAISLLYSENDYPFFLLSSAISSTIGVILLFMGRNAEKKLSRRDGYVIVSFSWITFSLLGSLPYFFGGYIPNFTDTFFESMSGFTSTGASIMNNIEEMPHAILFWRAFTQWIGGLGIVFFTLAVLPIFGVGGIQVFAAEASGPTHDKVHPRIGVTAKWIWIVYTGMTIVLAILLSFSDMTIFDSICHALTTTSTGGFSTKQASIGHYNSPYIEYVLTIFMFLSGINFTLLFCLFSGKIKKFIGDIEIKAYFIWVSAIGIFITAILYFVNIYDLEESFRKSMFQLVSLQTSTGYSTADYMVWPQVTWSILALVMLMGACAGSTSGGIKFIRLVVLFKKSNNEFKHILHPNAVLPVKINKHAISTTIQSTILSFTFLYAMICIVSIISMSALGVNFLDATGIVISSIGNMGAALGNFGPEYSWSELPLIGKWIASFLMLLGRLEIFTLLLLFNPDFWRKT